MRTNMRIALVLYSQEEVLMDNKVRCRQIKSMVRQERSFEQQPVVTDFSKKTERLRWRILIESIFSMECLESFYKRKRQEMAFLFSSENSCFHPGWCRPDMIVSWVHLSFSFFVCWKNCLWEKGRERGVIATLHSRWERSITPQALDNWWVEQEAHWSITPEALGKFGYCSRQAISNSLAYHHLRTRWYVYEERLRGQIVYGWTKQRKIPGISSGIPGNLPSIGCMTRKEPFLRLCFLWWTVVNCLLSISKRCVTDSSSHHVFVCSSRR